MQNTVDTVEAKVALPWVSLEGSEKFYKLDEQELEFFRTTTGIQDEVALKVHMIRVQQEAYAVRLPSLLLHRSMLSRSLLNPDTCISMHSDVLIHSVHVSYPCAPFSPLLTYIYYLGSSWHDSQVTRRSSRLGRLARTQSSSTSDVAVSMVTVT